MKIVFLLRSGMVEWDIPEDLMPTFNFMQTASKVRLDGYFIGPNIYLRHEELVGMTLVDGTSQPAFKPTGSTLQ
jgi:hypothetical protein